MDTSTNQKSAVNKVRAYLLGAMVASVMALPTTALGWDYAQTPLFWDTGVNPNVALMIDDSGSMHYLTTNETFNRYVNSGATTLNTNWYVCNGYNNATKLCTGLADTNAIDDITVQSQVAPSINATGGNINVGRTAYTGTSPSNCSKSTNGFLRSSSGSTTYNTVCSPNIGSTYGLTNGARLVLNNRATGAVISSGMVVGNVYYVVNVNTHGFQLSNTLGGAATNFVATNLGTSGNYTFKGTQLNTLPNYMSDSSSSGVSIGGSWYSAALCNVKKSPGDTDFYIGRSGTKPWLSTASMVLPASDEVGVILSNNSTVGSGNLTSCVRWKEANTSQQPTTAGTVCTTQAACDLYPASIDIHTPMIGPYPRFLLNKLITAKGSYNFSDSSTYPDKDLDPDTYVDATDKLVIPNLTRIEAAREAAQQIVLDNYDVMQVGLFSFMNSGGNYYGEMNQKCGDGSNPDNERDLLIGSLQGTTAADLPASAGDGAIGKLRAEHSTPLARSLYEIVAYFQGVVGYRGSPTYTSPISYRCQKNYAVLLTDGEANSDGGTPTTTNPQDTAITTNALPDWDKLKDIDGDDYLDDIAQFGYDIDLKTTGNDTAGKSYNTTELNNKWKQQNLTTFTIGFGLENDLLKNTPVVRKLTITGSNVSGSNMYYKNADGDGHGFDTGNHVFVLNAGATGLTTAQLSTSGSSTNTAQGRYFVAAVDGNNFKLATTAAKAATCAKGTTADCVTFANSASDVTVSSGPGTSFFAFTPEALATSLGSVFNQIRALKASASAVATNSKQLGGGTLVYQARFNTDGWLGDLAAYPIDLTNNTVSTVATWSSTTTLNGPADKGPMFTWHDVDKKGVVFSSGTISANQQAALTADYANVVSWLKGNDVAATTYRPHNTENGLLGDIINADPLYVGGFNFGYQKIQDCRSGTCTAAGTGADTYQAYSTANRRTYNTDGTINYSGRTPVLFTGSNDGMMHVFQADNGTELMSFIPNGVYIGWNDINNNNVKDAGELEKKLFDLTQKTYDGDNHRFFVDGAASAADAYDGSNWKTYMVGGLGAGGRSVYAIDATDTSYSATDILWEFTNPNLGLTYGKPFVARLANNKWYAIFPNGPDGAGDQASVFLVNMQDSNDWYELKTPVSAQPNGMMTINLEVNQYRTVTAIYGGDLRGNVWKFDVYNESTFDAELGRTGKLLFTARDSAGAVQSITGGITLGRLPPIAGNPTLKGTLVFFGTGKYFEDADKDFSAASVPQTDSLYAVLDEDPTTDNTVTTQTRSNLYQQTMTTVGDYRFGTGTGTDYSGTQRGWYIDLTNNGTKEGERVVTQPLLYSGRIIFVSMIPASGDRCIANGSSWLLELDALGGTLLAIPPLDYNGDGHITNADLVVSGKKLEGMASEPAIVSGSDRDLKIMGTTSSAKSILAVIEAAADRDDTGAAPAGVGRMSWKQLQ